MLGHFVPAYMVQIESDVYSQIGLVMLIGLAAKNAILIVEFAKDEFEKGRPLVDAALEGARLRLRPILMTSFAFILGCVPLWIATRRGRGGAADHGHHGDRRDGGGERHRHLPDSRHLLRGREAFGRDAAPDPAVVPPPPARRREIESCAPTSFSICWRCVVCAGCTVGPNYKRPAIATSRAVSARRSRCRRSRPLPSPT